MEQTFKAYEHKAQYYETDQMGIIHHSNYIRWFEEARTDLLEQIGFGYHQMEQEGIIVPVLAVTCEYKSMVRYGETVKIVPKIESFTGVRLTISYTITDQETNEVRTVGETQHCFLDKNYRPVSLKRKQKDIYDLFDNLLGKDLTR